MRFWDSSAVVPLLVQQSGSTSADGWFSRDRSIAVWALTGVEVASALGRLLREGRLQEAEVRDAEARSAELLAACHQVTDLGGVTTQALRLLRLHPLRSADALQLGAALEWSAGKPEGRVFHTFDTRLALAAQREGFRVNPVS